MPTLPQFNRDGLLPPNDYALTLAQLRDSTLVLGPGDPKDHPTWDAAWRLSLVDNLERLVLQLRSVGIDEVYIDGSFAEDKDHPNDIDGYFECDALRFASGRLERELNRLDPQKCWTWNPAARKPYRGYPKLQLPMWHAYRVELYPHYAGLIAGVDAHGNPWNSRHFSGSAVGRTSLRASSRL